MGVEVAIASAAAISKVAISNGHCTANPRFEEKNPLAQLSLKHVGVSQVFS